VREPRRAERTGVGRRDARGCRAERAEALLQARAQRFLVQHPAAERHHEPVPLQAGRAHGRVRDHRQCGQAVVEHLVGDSVTGREGFINEAMRWMDRYVKGVPAEQAPVEKDPPVEVEDGGLQRYRSEDAWPPADRAGVALRLRKGTITDQPGNDGEDGPGDGLWTVTQKLPYDVHLSGVPKLKLHAVTDAPRMNMFAILYDIQEGRARLITRAAYALKGPADTPVFELYPQDWTLKAGHRLGVLLADSDDGWFTPPPTFQSAEVSEAVLTYPALRKQRTAFLPSHPSQFERNRGNRFRVPEDTLKEAEVKGGIPPKMDG